MRKVIRYKRVDTPLGIVEIGAGADGICSIRFVQDEEQEIKESSSHGESPGDAEEEQIQRLLSEAQRQLTEYMEGRRKVFELPLSVEGTSFQKKVWEELRRIPYGETRTYGQIAALVGNPKGSRAVGMANHHNPVGIVVPCHRVIGADGKLTGYAGVVDKKAGLLKLEREHAE